MIYTEQKQFTAGNFTITQLGNVLCSECFLLLSPSSAFLYDSGFAFSAAAVVENLKRALGDRTLDYILLTHSHFDHVGGAMAAAEAYPDAKIVAHERCVKIFAKESARDFMKGMDAAAAHDNNMTPCPELFDRLRVDIPVTGGKHIPAADGDILVVEGPGHTWDSVGYFFPTQSLIASNESACLLIEGCGPKPIPEFIVSYRATLETIERFAALGAEHLLIPHYGIKSGADAKSFFTDAKAACKEVSDFVLTHYGKGLNEEEIAREIARVWHSDIRKDFQTDEAYVVNMRAMIPRLIAEQTA